MVGNTCHVNVDPAPKPPISVYTCACQRLPFCGVRNWRPTIGSTQVFEPSTLRTAWRPLMRRLPDSVVHPGAEEQVGRGAKASEPVERERALVHVDAGRHADGPRCRPVRAERHPDGVPADAPVALAGDEEAHGPELQVLEDVGGRHVDRRFLARDGRRAVHGGAHHVGRDRDVPCVAGRGLGRLPAVRRPCTEGRRRRQRLRWTYSSRSCPSASISEGSLTAATYSNPWTPLTSRNSIEGAEGAASIRARRRPNGGGANPFLNVLRRSPLLKVVDRLRLRRRP